MSEDGSSQKEIAPRRAASRSRGRRLAVICGEVVLGVILLCGLFFGLAVWRLSAGPVDVDFLTAYLDAAFNESLEGRRVEVGRTLLVWDEIDKEVEIRLHNTVLRDADGAEAAMVPEASVKLSLRALLEGSLAPTTIEIIGTQLELTRQLDGAFAFARSGADGVTVQEAATDQSRPGDLSGAFPRILEELLAEQTDTQPLRYLRSVSIRDGRIVIDDQTLDYRWQMPNADVELRRDAAGLAGTLKLDVGPNGLLARMEGGFHYDRTTQVIEAATEVKRVRLSALSAVFPELAPLGGVTLPLDAAISISLERDGRLRHGDFRVQGGSGTLELAALQTGAMPVRSFDFSGRLESRPGLLQLDRAELNLGTGEAGPVVEVSGEVRAAADLFADNLDVDFEASVRNAPLEQFEVFWPASVATNAREWILENLPQGMAKQATATGAMRVLRGDDDKVEVLSLTGGLQFEDLEVHYLRPLPPIADVSGTGSFDLATMTLTPESGRLGDLRVNGGTIEISGLRPEPGATETAEAMHIDVEIAGPLQQALEVLNHDRLQLLERVGIDPALTAGSQRAQLTFDFPLLSDLELDDVEIGTKVEVTGGVLRNFALNQDITAADLSLNITKRGMNAVGRAEFGGIAAEIDLKEDFTGTAPQRTRLAAKAQRLNEQDLARLGLDLGEALRGPMAANVLVTFDGKGKGLIDTSLDMRDAVIVVPGLEWRKPPGVAGQADVTLALQDDKWVALPKIKLVGEAFSIQGRGWPDGSGARLERLEFDWLLLGRTNLQNVNLQMDEESLDIAVGGGVLDASEILEDAESDAAAATPAGESVKEDTAPLALSVNAPRLDRLILSEGRALQSVAVDLERRSDVWRRIHLDGFIARDLWYPKSYKPKESETPEPPRHFKLAYLPAAKGGQALNISSNDFGATLRVLNFDDNVLGGTLKVTGNSEDVAPDAPLKAKIKAEDFALFKAPLAAQILTLASLLDFSAVLGGSGLPFKKLVGDFILKDGVLSTDLIRAYGNALGFTMKGTIDTQLDRLDLKGTVVPAYTFNRIIGEIPVLGTLLIGGEGEGIFAITYRIDGPIEDPRVAVNPLSALAPGFLRNIFSGGSGGGEDAIEKPAALPEDSGPDR